MEKIEANRKVVAIVIGVTLIAISVGYMNYRNSEEYIIKTTQPEKYQSLVERIQQAESRLSNSQDKSQEMDTLIQLGTYYQELGKYSKAVKLYQKALKINERHVIPWTNMAAIHKKNGNYNAAGAMYRKLIEIFPKDTQSYHNLVDLYMNYNVGKLEEISKIIKQGVEQTGDEALIRIYESLEKRMVNK